MGTSKLIKQAIRRRLGALGTGTPSQASNAWLRPNANAGTRGSTRMGGSTSSITPCGPALYWPISHGRDHLKTPVFLALLLSIVLLVPTAAADPPRDGSGFAISDDGTGSSLYGLGDGFERLRPKTVRFTVPYDAVDVPSEVDRAKAIINRAKEVGVTEILVSFRQRHDQWRPATECLQDPARPCDFVRPARAEWRTYVRRFMDTANGSRADGGPKTIDDDVTMWSPANQPNAGTGWLTGDDARAKLAGYFLELKEEIASRGSTDKVVSPEFHDHVDATGRPFASQMPFARIATAMRRR